jgi:hypothetical protein
MPMSKNSADRFCGQCGVSLVPLEVPHTSSRCGTCGKTRHHLRLGTGGKGIYIKSGESFTLPAGWLTMSFNPQLSRGKLARAGVPFLLKQQFLAGMPKQQGEMRESLQKLREHWQADLKRSDKLTDIDWSREGAGDAAFERLKDDKDSWEWNLLMRDVFAEAVLEALDGNDLPVAAHRALQLGLFHGLSVVTEPFFEELVWRGYIAGLVIHEAGAAADHVPGEVEALAELDPLFDRLGEATLRTWIDSGSPIGPRIGVSRLPEAILVARAKWHLTRLQREREEKSRQPAEHRAKSELRIKWLTFWLSLVGSGVVGSLVGKFWPAISG